MKMGQVLLNGIKKNHASEHSISKLLEMAAQIESGCEGLTAHPCAGMYPELSGFVHEKDICYLF